ncbi:MAG: hypothetical protein R6V36_02380, partial [Psychroflexus sp.]
MFKSEFNTNIFFVVFLILIGYNLQAQSLDKIELAVLLNELEDEHEVSFNYLYEDLENLEVLRPPGVFSLEEVLDFISQQLPVEFT